MAGVLAAGPVRFGGVASIDGNLATDGVKSVYVRITVTLGGGGPIGMRSKIVATRIA